MTKRILTEAEKEVIYDDLKSGAAYVKPEMPANPSPLLLDLIDWSEKEAQAYAERFAAGFRDGQEIAALVANTPGANLPQAIKDWIDRRLAEEASKDVERTPATLASLPSIEAQIAAIPPMSTNGIVDILAVTLPDNTELTRCIFNGAPAEWVELRWDEDQDVAIDIRGDGSISGVLIGEHYLDDVSEADWEALRLLLAVDRQAIGAATTIPTPVLDAIYAWNHQPYEQWKRAHETAGFGAWYEKRLVSAA